MITILHGTDEFRISERIKAVRSSMTPEDLRDINTTFLNAHENDVEELLLTASVVPFMAEQRLVIAKHFIGTIANKHSRPNKGSKSRLGLDETVLALSEIPDTTFLVLLEEDIGTNNSMIRKL